MTQWKPTARPSRSAPSARPAPPSSLPAFGAGSLSTGVVPVLVRPVAVPEVAEVVALVLWRIRGVGGVELVTVADGAAEFAVALQRPVALGSDLRSAFGRDLVACRRDGERFLVEIHPPAAPARAAPEAALRSPLAGPRAPAEHAASGVPGDGGPVRATDARPGTSSRSAGAPPRWAPVAGDAAPPRRAAGDAAPDAHESRPPAIPRPTVDTPPETPAHAAATPPGLPEPVAAVYDALDTDDALSILVTGPEHVIRTALGGLHRHFGRPDEGELVGRSLAEVLPLGAQQALADRVSAAVRGTRSTFVVEDLPGGRTCEFILRPAALGGAVHGCAVVARDITRRRRQDQVVGELTSVFDATFDASWVGIGLVSPRGEWLRVNPALERLLGHRGTVLVGMRVDDVTQVDDAIREARVRERAERAGDPSYELEKRMVRAQGEVFVAQVRMTAIIESGVLRGWVAHVAESDAVTRLEAGPQGGRSRGALRRLGA